MKSEKIFAKGHENKTELVTGSPLFACQAIHSNSRGLKDSSHRACVWEFCLDLLNIQAEYSYLPQLSSASLNRAAEIECSLDSTWDADFLFSRHSGIPGCSPDPASSLSCRSRFLVVFHTTRKITKINSIINTNTLMLD